MIELIGETNVDPLLLDYYNNDVWLKQEKKGLLYVNHFRWRKAISKNLILEIFEILKPKPLTTQVIRPDKLQRKRPFQGRYPYSGSGIGIEDPGSDDSFDCPIPVISMIDDESMLCWETLKIYINQF